MMVLAGGLALILGMALLVYQKRRSKKFFDPHHEQAFEVLARSFPDADAMKGTNREETAHA